MEHDIGKTGRTVGRLRPYGPVEIEGTIVAEAKAESGWIDEGMEIVIVRQTSFAIVVRERERVDGDLESPPESAGHTRRELDTSRRAAATSAIPLDGPEFWLERVNMILAGAIVGTGAGLLMLALGRGNWFDVPVLFFGGGISGAFFRYFVRGARSLEGAYTDHRPKAYYFAICMMTGAVLGVAAAASLGVTALSLSVGLVAGTLSAGLFALGTQML